VSSLTDHDLKEAYVRGLIPGPSESEQHFISRISQIKQKVTTLLACFMIDWVPILYKNEGLRFWEGACTWIGEGQAVLQIKKQYQNSSKLWGIYSKRELIEHELVHAVRLAFEEPKFEEILAYQRSTSFYRRYFGPLYENPKETLLYIILAALTPIPLFTSFILPIFSGVTLLALVRLALRQHTFQSAKKNLLKYLDDPSHVETLMLHLTDKEIIFFSKKNDVESYIKAQSCLRWRQIKTVYAWRFLCETLPTPSS
jgi:hypothetical protein